MAAAAGAAPPSEFRWPIQSLEQSLAYGYALVSSVETFIAAFGLEDGIELPPAAGGPADQSTLRIAAPLYLASELESARLLPAVETLAGLFATGGIEVDLGTAGERLYAFWRKRDQRFTSRERQAMFARLFGCSEGPALAASGAPGEETHNDAFEELLINVCDELIKLEPDPRLPGGRSPSEARLRLAANVLAENLLPRSGGMAAFAARDLLGTTQEALEILKIPAVQRFAGAQSVWAAVEQLARRYLRESVVVAPHVVRAKQGQIVLAWLAEAFPAIQTGGRLVRGGEPVLEAAQGWLEASLALAERRA